MTQSPALGYLVSFLQLRLDQIRLDQIPWVTWSGSDSETVSVLLEWPSVGSETSPARGPGIVINVSDPPGPWTLVRVSWTPKPGFLNDRYVC